MKEFRNGVTVPYVDENLIFYAPTGFEFSTKPGTQPEFREPEHNEWFLTAENLTKALQKTYSGIVFGPRLILKKIPPQKVEPPAPSVDKKPTVAFKYIETRQKLVKGEWYKDGNHGFVKLNQDWDFAPFSPREVYERIEL